MCLDARSCCSFLLCSLDYGYHHGERRHILDAPRVGVTPIFQLYIQISYHLIGLSGNTSATQVTVKRSSQHIIFTTITHFPLLSSEQKLATMFKK